MPVVPLFSDARGMILQTPLCKPTMVMCESRHLRHSFDQLGYPPWAWKTNGRYDKQGGQKSCGPDVSFVSSAELCISRYRPSMSFANEPPSSATASNHAAHALSGA